MIYFYSKHNFFKVLFCFLRPWYSLTIKWLFFFIKRVTYKRMLRTSSTEWAWELQRRLESKTWRIRMVNLLMPVNCSWRWIIWNSRNHKIKTTKSSKSFRPAYYSPWRRIWYLSSDLLWFAIGHKKL